MYIRFVISEKDEKSNKEMGLFSAMSTLHDKHALYSYEIELEKEIYQWFKKNLKVPNPLASDSNHYAEPRAISWFKLSATEHINKMRQYAQILEAHDVTVTQLKSDRPGKVIYEDQHQIAAIPNNDTFK